MVVQVAGKRKIRVTAQQRRVPFTVSRFFRATAGRRLNQWRNRLLERGKSALQLSSGTFRSPVSRFFRATAGNRLD
ncbi:hypothetical protein ACFQ88_29090 [Paenibacillus sp. NPDC056579]|uniref:hypothetical protein n=1 Tax=Paenibacillus sp. NPDC056579 TaxID=3345871 RepID=UPI003690A298